MLLNALLWITGQVDGDAAPRASTPVVATGGIGDALVLGRPLQPGSLVSIYGTGLTTGSTMQAGSNQALKLAGTQVLADGQPIPLLYVSPSQINAVLPSGMVPGATSTIQVLVPGAASNVVSIYH